MKKVCILTSVHSPFDTRIFHKQANSLQEHGYLVSLIAPYDKNENKNNINIIGVKKYNNRFLRFFITIFLVLKTALKSDADVFHLHDPELLLITPILYLIKNKPIIYDVHEHYPNSIMSKKWIPKYLKKIVKYIFIFIENILLLFVSGVIYTTPVVGERYIKKNVVTKSVDNYPKLDLLNYDLNEKNIDYNQLIYVGGITEIRGLIQVIESISIVKKYNKDIKFKIIGEIKSNELKNKIKKLIDELNLNKNIILKEFMPYEKLGTELAQSAIGIVTYLPYPNNLSCLPNKLFEYMATKNVVIASDFPLYRNVINNSNGGLLVNPENPEDIAIKIISLLEDKDLIKQKAMSGYESIKNKYNWNVEKQKLFDLYQKLL